MKFNYLSLPTRGPVYPLGGARSRHRPIVPIRILAPGSLPPLDACCDSASDDTVFPDALAARLGIDLAGAPQGEVRPAGHPPLTVAYAQVTLLLSDGYETCEWDAIVAFALARLRWALLGHAGFLQFFDVQLLGAKQQVVITPNATFPGQHTIHQSSPP
ncbi:MAG: hypothetical protein L0Z62_48740 [Gemmataceae bacterium]|nr:hypothetical protein [Gemmataceae bacterium]